MAKGSFGELLKRERELREVSLNELTVKTRVPPKFLEALENEEWGKLPGGVFNRGFVRAIARYLGLSEEHFLAEYDLAHSDRKVIAPPAPPNPIPSPPKWLVGLGLLVILIALAGVVAGAVYGWRRYNARWLHRCSRRRRSPRFPISCQKPPRPLHPTLWISRYPRRPARTSAFSPMEKSLLTKPCPRGRHAISPPHGSLRSPLPSRRRCCWN
jgi:hypothetical protein